MGIVSPGTHSRAPFQQAIDRAKYLIFGKRLRRVIDKVTSLMATRQQIAFGQDFHHPKKIVVWALPGT